MFQTKVVEKIKTRILCSTSFSFRKLCRLRDIVTQYLRARSATDDSMAHPVAF